jgi:hypothetical protein
MAPSYGGGLVGDILFVRLAASAAPSSVGGLAAALIFYFWSIICLDWLPDFCWYLWPSTRLHHLSVDWPLEYFFDFCPLKYPQE